MAYHFLGLVLAIVYFEEVDISVGKMISEVESRSIFCDGFIHLEVDGCFGIDSTNVKMPNKYI